MDAFPHRYTVRGSGRVVGDVEMTAERLPGFEPQFYSP